MFGALTSWIQTAAQSGEEATQSLLERAGLGLQTSGGDAHPADRIAAGKPYSIEDVPERWCAVNAASDWPFAVSALLRDENTYLIAPDRLLAMDRISAALGAACPAFAASGNLPPLPDFDRDCASRVAAISAVPGVREMHYLLVPKLVSDSHFWCAVCWRLDLLSLCDPACCAAVLRVVNTEPLLDQVVPGAPRQKNVGTVPATKLFDELERQLAMSREASEWIRTKRDTISTEFTSCRSNAQLLANLVLTSDANSVELTDSVADSCRYQKSKIAGYIAELEKLTEELTNSGSAAADLLPPHGATFVELLEVNEMLCSALKNHGRWRSEVLERDANPSSSNAAAVALPTAGGGEPNAKLASPIGQSTAHSTADVTAATFTATLPWDDEE